MQYDIQLWGCAQQMHINNIQNVQNKVLRNIVTVTTHNNADLHCDLGMYLAKSNKMLRGMKSVCTTMSIEKLFILLIMEI